MKQGYIKYKGHCVSFLQMNNVKPQDKIIYWKITSSFLTMQCETCLLNKYIEVCAMHHHIAIIHYTEERWDWYTETVYDASV